MAEMVIIGLAVLAVGLLYYIKKLRDTVSRCQNANTDLKQQFERFKQDTSLEQVQVWSLCNAAYDALLVVDAAYQIVALNASAIRLFNDPGGKGKNLVEMTNTPELEVIVRGALTNEDEGFEEQISIKDRSYRVRAICFRGADNVFIGIALQDITQLVRLNRARRDMVANISHELRTPIANIRLIIDGLFHEQDKPKRKESISSLRAIAHETDSLLWLVQEMSDLSMIESGQAIVRMYEVGLSELVNEAIERVADQSQVKKVQIVQEIPDHVRVLCDRDLTKRVLINLIHNAMKWSPTGETVMVRAVNGADEVTVSVLDKGPGVPDDQCERIFERFYQVDASRSGHEGTGLGLSICKHIVEAHGGRIWAEGNSKGGGGQFMFTLLSAEADDD